MGGDEVEQAPTDADALVVGEDHEAGDPFDFRVDGMRLMEDGDEPDRLPVKDGHIALGGLGDVVIQIVIPPKGGPVAAVNWADLEIELRTPSFFFANSIVSVLNSQSGSSQSRMSE